MMSLSHFLLLFFIFFIRGCSTSISHELSYCHEESSALLQFKQSFTISCSLASGLEGAYPKVSSWKPTQGNNTNCCRWDGVECDEHTGHVIGLDLRSSCLYGVINSNSSLFRLVHLQRLDLADNHFNYSQIPSSIRNFPRLTHLDLSASVFSGRVPAEVSQLVELSLLDLSENTEPSSGLGLLRLDGSNFRSLAQNLTRLEHLVLRLINISSTIPYTMANLSFLTTLDLYECELFGDFPVTIFHLQDLRSVYVRDNRDLNGYLPEFNQSSRLITLDIHGTRFSGNFPSSIGKVESLQQLDVAACNFSEGLVPASIGNLRQLVYLDISANKFVGPIPNSFANLTQLTVFRIGTSPLTTGPIPAWIGNFNKLVYLDFSYSGFDGSILASFSNLTNLEILYLQFSYLRGTIEFQTFQNLQNLNQLDLSFNNLEVLIDSVIMNATIPQFEVLKLSRCNLTQFPYFLRYQKNLQYLSLEQNKIHGQVPIWMWNMSTGSLKDLNLGSNFLSGFEELPTVLPWVNLRYLKLAYNMFHGSLPIPAASTLAYEVNDNNFSGEVPPGICNTSSLLALDMSNNNFSGMIPQCFGNFSDLKLLLLRNNSFHGNLPQTYNNKSNLRMFDVSQNQLQGQLPRSLANCQMLELLILSNNNFSDVFPFWLRNLPELKLLAMRHNRFHGVIGKPENNQQFPKLRLLDISYNSFTGQFLAEHIFSEFAMRPNIPVSQTTYLGADVTYEAANGVFTFSYGSVITITSKGVDRYYSKIQEAFAVIDISSNKFEGKIDEWIGNLKGLRSLNVSNNLLTGGIPLSLGKLAQVESLDLSNNKLSGMIPQQLAQLTFLAEFNVSHNNLKGPIPSGTQLRGFNVTCYEGNTELCGDPLPKKCGNSTTPTQAPPSGKEENSLGSETTFNWIFVAAGYVSGLVVGAVLADIAITRRQGMFLDIVGTLIRLKESFTIWKRFI